MELTEQQMRDVVNDIASESPEILLNALRQNGFWLYAMHKSDIDTALEYSKDADMVPVTNEDVDYINNRDINRGVISDAINYDDLVQNMVINLRDFRNFRA